MWEQKLSINNSRLIHNGLKYEIESVNATNKRFANIETTRQNKRHLIAFTKHDNKKIETISKKN